MASRLARSAVGAARLRPVLLPRTPASISATLTTHRYASNVPSEPPAASSVPSVPPAVSNVPSEPPAKKAQSIIDALPGSTLISKTAILSAGASISAYLISNEYYVVNEETVTMVATLGTFFAIAYYFGPAIGAWADAYRENQLRILNAARQGHVDSVQERIDNIKKLGSVIDVTKGLFEVSKETAQLEAQAYELEQKTALVTEAKSTLDSWVRYEGQQKARQQKELAESIIAKIQKELENPKTLQQILQQSVADVEKIVASKAQ